MRQIPRIIHQTWRNNNLPDELLRYQETWKRNHPAWNFRLWTDEDNHDFIQHYYPWFLPTYEAYPKKMMRVDSVRYFILHQHGGVYIDLDFECLKPMDDLLKDKELLLGIGPDAHLKNKAVIKRNLNKIIVNAWMASIPDHPFWSFLVWVLTINSHLKFTLDATGPYLLTRAVELYKNKNHISFVPPDILYPIDMWGSKRGQWQDAAFRQQAIKKAIAVHHWHGSWWEGEVEEMEQKIKAGKLVF